MLTTSPCKLHQASLYCNPSLEIPVCIPLLSLPYCATTILPLHVLLMAILPSIHTGVYNEVAFQGLDKIINDAGEAGVKLILALTDNWHFQDGLFQYVEWGNSMATGDFFTDPAIIQIYKNHLTAVTSRVNTLNGRMYKDDPAIFAWDLINELRDGCNTSAPNATCDPTFTGSVQVRNHLRCCVVCILPAGLKPTNCA